MWPCLSSTSSILHVNTLPWPLNITCSVYYALLEVFFNRVSSVNSWTFGRSIIAKSLVVLQSTWKQGKVTLNTFALCILQRPLSGQKSLHFITCLMRHSCFQSNHKQCCAQSSSWHISTQVDTRLPSYCPCRQLVDMDQVLSVLHKFFSALNDIGSVDQKSANWLCNN